MNTNPYYSDVVVTDEGWPGIGDLVIIERNNNGTVIWAEIVTNDGFEGEGWVMDEIDLGISRLEIVFTSDMGYAEWELVDA